MVSIHVANRPSDGMHPYGYKRYETLGNIVISIVLMVLAVGIAVDALYGQSVQQILNWKLVLPMAALAVIVNELAYRYVMYYATMLSSDILKSLAVHQRSDAATSSVVLISVLSFLLGLGASDQIAALIISAMILYYALPATLKSIAELLDRGLGKDEVQKIEAVIADVEGVLDFHLLRSRQMASKGLLDVHIVVDSMISVSEGHYIGDLVEYQIKKKCKVEDVTVR